MFGILDYKESYETSNCTTLDETGILAIISNEFEHCIARKTVLEIGKLKAWIGKLSNLISF